MCLRFLALVKSNDAPDPFTLSAIGNQPSQTAHGLHSLTGFGVLPRCMLAADSTQKTLLALYTFWKKNK
jgi:hypothetical protein